MRLEPLGDQAVVAYGNDEKHATEIAALVRHNPPDWCIDVVQAYVSVAVFYDLSVVNYAEVCAWLSQLEGRPIAVPAGRLHQIPCCYEFGLDFDRIEKHTGLTREDAIRVHIEAEYVVYAIGFCPGFPYLGYLPPPLSGVPRLESPRLKVEAGCVGLTGRQTGIYTEARPGGWNIVGRTPLELVNVRDEFFPLRTGDRVQFRRIDEVEFGKLQGERLKTVEL